MRQQLAAWAAVLCLSALTLLSMVVARRLDPGESLAVAIAAPRAAADTVPPGRGVYDSLGCAGCHAVAGEGNVRNPLDGVGERLEPVRLRAWIVGDASLADSLPPSAFRRKQAYAALGEEEMEALMAYLLGLSAG